MIKFNDDGTPDCTGENSPLSAADRKVQIIVGEEVERLRAAGATSLEVRAIGGWFHGSVACEVAANLLRMSLNREGGNANDFFDANGVPVDQELLDALTKVDEIAIRQIDRLREAGASGMELRVVGEWFSGSLRLATITNILRTNALNRIAAREALKNAPPAAEE